MDEQNVGGDDDAQQHEPATAVCGKQQRAGERKQQLRVELEKHWLRTFIMCIFAGVQLRLHKIIFNIQLAWRGDDQRFTFPQSHIPHIV